METTFIYALCEPDTGEIRYIGKADDPFKRYGEHLVDLRDGSCKTNWIRARLKKGLTPALKIIDEVWMAEWQAAEAAYIQFCWEQGLRLVNRTLGGDGASAGELNHFFGKTHTPETRNKISIAQKRPKSPESNRKRSLTQSGEGNHNFGKQHSVETRRKISVGNTGKRWTEERRKAMSLSRTGRKMPREGVEKSRNTRLMKNEARYQKALELLALGNSQTKTAEIMGTSQGNLWKFLNARKK